MTSVIVGTTKLSTKGQGIVPKSVREYMQAEKDTTFVVVALDKETMVWKKIDKEKLVGEFRNIRNAITQKLEEEEIDEIVHRTR